MISILIFKWLVCFFKMVIEISLPMWYNLIVNRIKRLFLETFNLISIIDGGY